MTRNKILLTLTTLCIYTLITAQVWTEPAFPTKLDDVTVYFDATQGNAALAGFQGNVYAHTGVITSESTNGNDWKHVVGNWGTADPQVLMTRVSDDLYSISYNITDFYGIPGPEEVLKMAFVFRNSTGSIVGRASDGSDIFTDVYPAENFLFLDIRSPQVNTDILIYEGDSILIDLVVSDSAQLTITDDGEEIFSGMTDQATFYHHPVGAGRHILYYQAVRDTLFADYEQSYFVIPSGPAPVDPPAGSLAGINYPTDSTYLFQLYAPDKDYVFLLTSANDFQADTAYQLHVAEDGNTYWIELPRSAFTQGRNTYQYLVSDGLRVADPHSEVVLDPNNDQWVSPQVMATLPPYPVGLANGIVTAFDEEKPGYAFQDFDKPEKKNLVIYELLIRDFLADHSYTSLIDTLDYFARLGVTAIELMPIHEFEGNDSWGYNPSFHMAVDKYYGTREQLKAFIDAAHERGIAVIQDVVFNHAFSQSPLAQMYWDPVNFRPAPSSPYFNVVPRHPFNVGYDFNHESQATKQWVKRILAYWIDEFHFDGFRFDLSKGLTQFNSGNDAGLMAQYDAGRIAILEDYADLIWSHDSTAYVILEHFADNSEEIVLSNYGMMLWGNMNYQFNQAAKGLSSDLDGIDYTFRGWTKPHLVGYMESHDEERLMYRLYNEGNVEGSYNTREVTTALQRVEAASTIFYTVPGPRMLWEFGELGYDFSINRCTDGSINNDCRLSPKPIRWDYLDDYRREHLRYVTQSLIHLRNTYPTFSTEDFDFNDGNLYIKTVHLNHPDMDAAVLANFRVTESEFNPKFQYPGTWYEYFTGDSLEVEDTQARLTFGPGEYRIYTSKRITPPEGFVSGVFSLPVEQLAFYPTLIGSEARVSAILPVEGDIALKATVTDVSGKVIPCIVESADQDIQIRLPETLQPGMYFLSVKTQAGYYFGRIVR